MEIISVIGMVLGVAVLIYLTFKGVTALWHAWSARLS